MYKHIYTIKSIALPVLYWLYTHKSIVKPSAKSIDNSETTEKKLTQPIFL